jgi:hypothetical protein
VSTKVILDQVIAVTDDREVIRKILDHLGLWEPKPRPPPLKSKIVTPYAEPYIDYSESQVPPSDNALYVDPEYPADSPV